MTVHSTGQVRCGRCGRPHAAELYTSIDISTDPDLKEKVRDGSVFVSECPYCGSKCLSGGNLLYRDPAAKVMISLLPEGFPGERPEDPEGLFASWTTRLVRTPGELVEKICILDSGLEDTAIEMVKFVTAQDLKEEPSGPMRFYRIEGADNDLVFTFPSGEEMKAVTVGFGVYEDCSAVFRRNEDLLPKGLFPEVNVDWIESMMK